MEWKRALPPKPYGWKMALYILAVFLAILIGASLLMHYGFALAGLLASASSAKTVTQRDFFAVDYTLFLNAVFIVLSGAFLIWKARTAGFMESDTDSTSERILRGLSGLASCG